MPINPEIQEKAAAILAGFNDGPVQLADMLAAIQHGLGYIPPSTVPLVATKAGLSRPEVYRAIELAPSFSLVPPGKHLMYICNAENCCMHGGDALLERARQRLGIREFQTTADQKIRLETFRCLGNCAMSPNVMVDGRIHGMMDEGQLDQLIKTLQQD